MHGGRSWSTVVKELSGFTGVSVKEFQAEYKVGGCMLQAKSNHSDLFQCPATEHWEQADP
jgi:hypothetical protein